MSLAGRLGLGQRLAGARWSGCSSALLGDKSRDRTAFETIQMIGDVALIEPVRLVLVTVIGFLSSTLGTYCLIRYLAKRQILDRPNERSSHEVPTPRGGGIAVLGAVVLAWLTGLGLSTGIEASDLVILLAAVMLGAVCFIDDLGGLGAVPRLIAQVLAVIPGLWFISETGGLFQSVLPAALDIAATGFLWLWFINLFNFMDGIDGISGVEIATVGIGLAGLAALGVASPTVLGPALSLTAAALGFLVWNWRPAKIFMGDVGSVPMGYLIGWLLISAAPDTGGVGDSDASAPLSDQVAWLILPAYYLADASITLARRLLRKENSLQAHRQHFYQKAVIRGVGHATVCAWIIAANAGLVITAWLVAPTRPAMALGVAAVIVAALLARMAAPWRAPRRPAEAE